MTGSGPAAADAPSGPHVQPARPLPELAGASPRDHQRRGKQPAAARAGAARSAAPATAEPSSSGVLPGLPSPLIAVVEGATPPPAALAAGSDAATPARGHTGQRAQAAVSDRAGAGPASNEGAGTPAISASPVPAIGLTSSGPAAVSLLAGVVGGADPAQQGLFLPFEIGVGAAAFARGSDVFVVFDVVRPLDLSAVQSEPAADGASIQLLPAATLLRLPHRRLDQLALRRVQAGWVVGGAPAAVEAPIPYDADRHGLRFPVSTPGRSVVVPDPLTRAGLLVGTIRAGADRVATTRHGGTLVIEQTAAGVVIDPLSDRLELRPTADAFLLAGLDASNTSLASSVTGTEAESVGPRVLSLPQAPVAEIARRLAEARATAAATPPQARFLSRLAAAQDALALADPLEAQTLAGVAVADAPDEAQSPKPLLILAASALLQREPRAAKLPDQVGPENGEVSLWKAVQLDELDPGSAEAARRFAATLPLLRAYPDALRARLLPEAATSLARSGTPDEAALVDQLPQEPSLDFARALLAARLGRTKVALTLLDRLARSDDVRLAGDAAEEAVRLREPGGDPKQLADALEQHLLDARIAGHEVATRLHVAELRARAGQWREAFGLLREAVALYPDQVDRLRGHVGDLLARMVKAPATPGIDALDEASIIESSADMLPPGQEGSRISLALATKLRGLDLPQLAAPIVARMMQAALPGAEKAQLGAELAALQLQQNDGKAAQDALQRSGDTPPSGTLAPELLQRREILLARALAMQGQSDQALSLLAGQDADEALELRAQLLEQRKDWTGAADGLLLLAGRQIRDGHGAPGAQDLLLRLASDASRAGDPVLLAKVRALGPNVMTDAAKRSLFRLLTGDAGAETGAPARIADLHAATAALDRVTQAAGP